MLTKAEVFRAVKNKASELTEEEIFSAPAFFQLMQDTVSAITFELGRTPTVKGFYDVKDDTTAFTDNNIVVINSAGPFIRCIPSIWEKYLSNFGHMTHECGHVLFTDFKAHNKRMEAWCGEKFSFYGHNPVIKGYDADELVDYLNTHPNYRQVFVKHLADLNNILEDVYIENRLYEVFNGLCTAGLHKVNDEDYRLSEPINKYLQAVVEGKTIPLSVALNLIHLRKLGYKPKQDGELTLPQKKVFDEIQAVLDTADSRLNALCWEGNGSLRTGLLNEVALILAPLFPRPDDNEDLSSGEEGGQQGQGQGNGSSSSQGGSSGQGQGGQGGNGQNNQNGKPSVKDLVQALTQMMNESGVKPEPKGNTSPVQQPSNSQNQNEAEKQKQQAEKLSQSEKAVQNMLNQLKQDIAQAIVEQKAEEQHVKEMQDEANKIAQEGQKFTSNQYFSNYNIFRASKAALSTNKGLYEEIRKQIAKTSDALVRKISNIWKDRETDSETSGYLFGQKFNIGDVFRGDGKYFSRINEPDGKLRVCFGVLIDESGSMGGENSYTARKVAILFEDVLRRLNVPHIIVGHTTGRGQVRLNSYVDFDTVDGADKYRLVDISAYASNNDGAAIKYVGDKLAKRSEEIKVMIVISDGYPTGCSFYSDNSCEDTMMSIKACRKKNIKVFGAVVDQWETVSELYRQEYSFDCRENGVLEQQFIKLIKKYCVNIH